MKNISTNEMGAGEMEIMYEAGQRIEVYNTSLSRHEQK